VAGRVESIREKVIPKMSYTYSMNLRTPSTSWATYQRRHLVYAQPEAESDQAWFIVAYLALSAEDVGIVLLKAPHARQATQGPCAHT
jgi:hypothetical protein